MHFRLLIVIVVLTMSWVQGVVRADEASLSAPQTTQKKDNNIRAWHFVLRDVSLERAYWMVDLAKKAGFNTVVVQLADGVKLDHAPWTYLSSAWRKEEFVTWVQGAQNQGMEVVPELKLLTHQEKFFQNNHPELMFNRSTYDPRIDKTFEFVFAFLDEIIEIIGPKAIHIGHDEVAGHNKHSKNKWLRINEKILPADYFLQHVVKIHDYLKQKGIETWLWGDMLISPNEFPTMQAQHLHGSISGYGKPLRDKIPKDIVICDWHYFGKQSDFPSLNIMQKEGFRVLGSTWKNEKTIRNFSQYAAQHNTYGMMATTWFHVQRKEWDVVKRIIKVSGETFSKDFPDEK